MSEWVIASFKGLPDGNPIFHLRDVGYEPVISYWYIVNGDYCVVVDTKDGKITHSYPDKERIIELILAEKPNAAIVNFCCMILSVWYLFHAELRLCGVKFYVKYVKLLKHGHISIFLTWCQAVEINERVLLLRGVRC